MNDQRHLGTIKFYSVERGFGFIAQDSSEDIFFHISQINGPNPPVVGQRVSFKVVENTKKMRLEATFINIHSSANTSPIHSSAKNPNDGDDIWLDGFPCIRGSNIRGFRVEKSYGLITGGLGGFWTPRAGTVKSAKDNLIEKAKRKGANAVFQYVWHSERERRDGLFGGVYYDQTFWCEGEAVLLARDK